jgi:hypothetical protein
VLLHERGVPSSISSILVYPGKSPMLSRVPGGIAWRAWEKWAAETGRLVVDIPGIESVEQRSEVTGVSLPLVSIRSTYTFGADGAVIVSDSTLRFRSRDEVTSSLVAHGYRVLDVREAPDRPGREFVFIAERTT